MYDTSGPYTDPHYSADFTKGLPALREKWILERGDVETYEGRQIKPEDNGYKSNNDPRATEKAFPALKRKPLRAKAGSNVTQLHYAKRESLHLKWSSLQSAKIWTLNLFEVK